MNSFIVACAIIAAASAGPIIPGTAIYSSLGPILPGLPVFARTVVGLEGQYVPDNTEKLYDDGAYKPEPVVKTAESEGQYVPETEGAYVPDTQGSYVADTEGSYVADKQGDYVPDNLEKSYDDGSYKGEPLSVVAPYTAALPYSPYAPIAPIAPYVPYNPYVRSFGFGGQYIANNLEKFYDDGSYKPLVYV